MTSRQFRQQSLNAQRDIYDSHRHRVFALAFYMTGNEIEAEEILTSTFVKAFREEPKPSGCQVDLALVAELRQRLPLDQHEPAPDVQISAGAKSNLGTRNVRRTDLEEAIQTLPHNERLLFLLRDVEGYSPAAISELLQMAEAKVQRGLISARIRLRRALAAGTVVELPVGREAEQDAA